MSIISYTKKKDPGSVFYNRYNHFDFENDNVTENNDLEYMPLFGVGGISETNTWSSQSRPIKITPFAITFYDIPDGNTYEYLLGKEVGVIRRIVKNGIKTNKYNCPKYKLLEINYPHMWSLCTAKIQCLKTMIIEDKINISRLSTPKKVKFDF